MDPVNEKLDLIENLALMYEAEIGSCPQCVLSALMEVLGTGSEELVKAADGLAGGSALSAEGTCGALAGGILALGTIVGRSYAKFREKDKKRRIFRFTKILYDKFLSEYKSPICKNIQSLLYGRAYNLLDPDEYALFKKEGAAPDRCQSVAGKTARWTAEIILNELNDLPKDC